MVIVVKWSACWPPTWTIWVQIPLNPTVFLNFFCRKERRKTKWGWGWPISKRHVLSWEKGCYVLFLLKRCHPFIFSVFWSSTQRTAGLETRSPNVSQAEKISIAGPGSIRFAASCCDGGLDQAFTRRLVLVRVPDSFHIFRPKMRCRGTGTKAIMTTS